MGGRGGGSPAVRAPEALTRGEIAAREFHIAIIEKPANGPWRLVGDGPEEILGEAAVHVSRSGNGYVVRNSNSDETLASGRSIADALRALARRTGRVVNYYDETTERELGRFEP